MKILCLYGNECAIDLWKWLGSQGHQTVVRAEKINDDWVKKEHFDFAISYTYPYIIRQSTIDILKGKIVNLHTSFLPYNRGSNPNIWSIVDNTPRGVTLHYIDSGIDSGDIIAQTIVPIEDGASLKSSYEQLDLAAKQLFKDSFKFYEFWPNMRKKAIGSGNFHTDKDFLVVKSEYKKWDWEISVDEFLRDIKKVNRSNSV